MLLAGCGSAQIEASSGAPAAAGDVAALQQAYLPTGPCPADGFIPSWRADAVPATKPSLSGAMAYDSSRKRLVFHTSSNETWEYAAGAWTKVADGAAVPSTRDSATLVYDASRSKVVLFGGRKRDGYYLSDTWEWDGTQWTKRSTAASPPPRFRHSMVYDPVRKRSLILGGQNNSGLLGDVWAFNGTNWSQIASTNPVAGSHAAYDEARSRVVIFGGQDPYGQFSSTTVELSGDSVAYPSLTRAPGGRRDGVMFYDPTRRKVVLFGGVQRTTAYLFFDRDMWEYDGAAWQEIRPPWELPPTRYQASVAFDSDRQRPVLYGGVFSLTTPLPADYRVWQFGFEDESAQRPVWPVVPTQRVTLGDLLKLTLTATSPGGHRLSYTVSGLPSGAYLTDGVLTFRPHARQAGTYPIRITAADGCLSSTLALTVEAVPADYTYAQLPSGAIDLRGRYWVNGQRSCRASSICAPGAGQADLECSIKGNNPGQLTLDCKGGVLFKPATVGTYFYYSVPPAVVQADGSFEAQSDGGATKLRGRVYVYAADDEAYLRVESLDFSPSTDMRFYTTSASTFVLNPYP